MTAVVARPLVIVASGVAALRKRWRQSLHGPFVTQDAGDRSQLDRNLSTRTPLAILLDLALPQLGGVAGVGEITRARPTTKVVVLTSRPDEREGIAALKAGARGYCDRDIEAGLLQKALHVVQDGEIWIGRKLIPHLLEELTAAAEHQPAEPVKPPDDRLDRITPREREIAQLLSAGASNKDIAKRLSVTERTVKAHLTAVFRKLGVSGRLQLALFVLEHSRPRARDDAPRPGLDPAR